MAMTPGEPDIIELDPKWPELADIFSKGKLTFTYDAASDTMFVDFYGPGRPAVSVEIERGDHDYVFQRVDLETQEVIGLQIEDFLAYAVYQDPYMLDALDFAELVGITPQLVELVKRNFSATQDHASSAESFMGELAKMTA